MDNYVFRTIPVLQLRADILKRKNTPFVFADAGPQFCWPQNNQEASSFYSPEYKGGFYFNAGAGYKMNLFKECINLSLLYEESRGNAKSLL